MSSLCTFVLIRSYTPLHRRPRLVLTSVYKLDVKGPPVMHALYPLCRYKPEDVSDGKITIERKMASDTLMSPARLRIESRYDPADSLFKYKISLVRYNKVFYTEEKTSAVPFGFLKDNTESPYLSYSPVEKEMAQKPFMLETRSFQLYLEDCLGKGMAILTDDKYISLSPDSKTVMFRTMIAECFRHLDSSDDSDEEEGKTKLLGQGDCPQFPENPSEGKTESMMEVLCTILKQSIGMSFFGGPEKEDLRNPGLIDIEILHQNMEVVIYLYDTFIAPNLNELKDHAEKQANALEIASVGSDSEFGEESEVRDDSVESNGSDSENEIPVRQRKDSDDMPTPTTIIDELEKKISALRALCSKFDLNDPKNNTFALKVRNICPIGEVYRNFKTCLKLTTQIPSAIARIVPAFNYWLELEHTEKLNHEKLMKTPGFNGVSIRNNLKIIGEYVYGYANDLVKEKTVDGYYEDVFSKERKVPQSDKEREPFTKVIGKYTVEVDDNKFNIKRETMDNGKISYEKVAEHQMENYATPFFTPFAVYLKNPRNHDSASLLSRISRKAFDNIDQIPTPIELPAFCNLYYYVETLVESSSLIGIVINQNGKFVLHLIRMGGKDKTEVKENLRFDFSNLLLLKRGDRLQPYDSFNPVNPNNQNIDAFSLAIYKNIIHIQANHTAKSAQMQHKIVSLRLTSEPRQLIALSEMSNPIKKTNYKPLMLSIPRGVYCHHILFSSSLRTPHHYISAPTGHPTALHTLHPALYSRILPRITFPWNSKVKFIGEYCYQYNRIIVLDRKLAKVVGIEGIVPVGILKIAN